ncbi:vWA domain-containing protein [Thiofilum flexile]|uniref:vWA domain-containing protein n=1 Tax=Thiofilum flexile TaxID=125627 RepID=UPI000370F55B|nr:VWA domain-containing protein [Thiofilum flexile]
MKLFARTVIRYFSFISFSVCIGAPLLAADQQATMIILDGSNSMWTQVQGQAKVMIARESLDTLVKGAGTTSFGLTTYGGKCNSVKVVGGIGMDNTELLKRANKLMPKGRSPISSALKAAANEVKNSGNILLISDGEESCKADPCETAATLKQHYPNLVINVLGFNAKDEAQLQCIANNTGGRFVLAQNTASIGALFTDLQPIIEEKAIAGSSTNADRVVPLSSMALQNPGTLRLSLGEQGRTDNLRSSYFIYTPDNQLVAQMTQGEALQTELSAGTYRVNALWKGFRQSQTVTVKPHETTEYRFNLDKIGTLKLRATDANGQTVKANYALYDTHDKAITNHVSLEQVNERLPAGRYRVKATYNQSSLEQDIEVSPQGVSEQVFEFKASN